MRQLVCVWLFMGLVVCCLQKVHAAAPEQIRSFDTVALHKYTQKSDYQYGVTPVSERGIGSLIVYYFGKFLHRLLGVKGELTIVRVMFWLTMALALVMLAFNLLGISPTQLFRKNDVRFAAYNVQQENIHQTDFDALIKDSVVLKQWRLAVRYQYLKALRLLAERNYIHWQAGKTNYEYCNELKQPDIRTSFVSITLIFENAWYGTSEVSDSVYQDIEKQFAELRQKVNRT